MQSSIHECKCIPVRKVGHGNQTGKRNRLRQSAWPRLRNDELVEVRLPSGFAADCWDRNHDGLKDQDEDRNLDGTWDQRDCYPNEVTSLFVEYDATRLRPAEVESALAAAGIPISSSVTV